MKHKISLYWLLFTALLVALPSQAAEHVTYYVNDALGSPILAMDEQGAVVWQESYQPYGQRQIKPAAANYDEQFYTGKQEEPDIGLQYFGARWYDPEAGRFTSIDPVGVQEGEIHSFNRYAYANNNPYKFTDPNGESPLDVAFFAVDALAFSVAVASGNPQAMGRAGTDLAMSAIGLISPVPGTGQALKMVKAGKALDRISDGAKGAGGVDDWAKMSGMLRDAAKGKGNFGIGSGTREQADAMGKAWVGEGAEIASDGKTLLSADKLRQYRPPSSKPNSKHAPTGKQANFESRLEGQKSKQWQGNGHMDIVD